MTLPKGGTRYTHSLMYSSLSVYKLRSVSEMQTSAGFPGPQVKLSLAFTNCNMTSTDMWQCL